MADPSDNRNPQTAPVFLIGYRGSGKTTVARLLAERLGWAWLDADIVLEERFGKSIRQMFAEEGEPAFRDRESAVLADLCRLDGHVIATGGGVVMRPENRQKLRSGFVVWLTGDPQTLYQRMQTDSDPEKRPALTVGGLAEVEQLLKVREPLYRECADLVVETVGRSAEEIAAEILARLLPRT